ncbi:MAG: putative rane protein [Acidobacteria bacterium]|nr:putative rane protein [Acidobacteriota bacterium]
MFDLLIVAATLVCALQAIRSPRLLMSALWLASASALTALLMYLLGAPEVAVIELSVGAGLVTVLFVFAINIAGEELPDLRALVPKPLAWLVAIGAMALGAWMAMPGLRTPAPALQQPPFAVVLWEQRTVDVLLQVVLIIGGVLGVLGLLGPGGAQAGKEKRS